MVARSRYPPSCASKRIEAGLSPIRTNPRRPCAVVCHKPLAGLPSVTSPQTSRNNRVGRLKVAAFVTGTRKGLGPLGPGAACGQAPARPALVHGRTGFSHPPVGRRHVLDEVSNLLGRHACAARLHLSLHVTSRRATAPHLHHAGLDWTGRRLSWRTGLQLTYPVQIQSAIRPVADQQQLLQVPVFLPSPTLGAVRSAHQALRDTEPHLARRHGGMTRKPSQTRSPSLYPLPRSIYRAGKGGVEGLR